MRTCSAAGSGVILAARLPLCRQFSPYQARQAQGQVRMSFGNRNDAAGQLAQRLAMYRGVHPLVLAIPRGAVPMGRIIADALEGELDVVLAHKLSAPGNVEYAIGAVDETGWLYLPDPATGMGVEADWIEAQKLRQVAQLRQRRALYTPARVPVDAAGRVVIVVDDGLATGATMIAALHALRDMSVVKRVVAVPVAPPETLSRIAPLADEVICLLSPVHFVAVGRFYRDFPQISDDEVIAALRAAP